MHPRDLDNSVARIGQLAERAADEILGALEITDHLPAAQKIDVARRALATDILHARLQQLLVKKFAVEIISAMPDIEREALVKRVYARAIKRPSGWEVRNWGAFGKAFIHVQCGVCGNVDAIAPPEPYGVNERLREPDEHTPEGITQFRVIRPTLESIMANARAYRFKHCGKVESAPDDVLREYERRNAAAFAAGIFND